MNIFAIKDNIMNWLKHCIAKAKGKFLRVISPGNFSKHHICHFSFHKNLTVYYARIANEFATETGRTRKHFNSFKKEFLSSENFDMRSVNNHFIEMSDLGIEDSRLRCSLFLRDPRDLVVSGYHYHKRGAEWWCNVKNPTEKTLETVNLHLPKRFLRQDESISDCMSRLDEEAGVQMEIEMRHPHFTTIRLWLEALSDNNSIFMLTYDEVFADNVGAMEKLAEHYLFTDFEKSIWVRLARKYARENVKTAHIRDPSIAQWKRSLMDSHKAYFENNYPDLVSYFDKLSAAR